MAIRQITHVLKHSNILNRPLPNTSLLGEPIVNTADGIVYFSGNSTLTQGWTSAGTGTTANFFEVGSNLYDLQLRHRITKYDNISTTGLTGKFLSGTSNGFVLSDISNIQGIDTYVTGGTYSTGTTVFTNNFGSTFEVTGYTATDIYVTGGTYFPSAATLTFNNNFGNLFNVSGTTFIETNIYKQNNMNYDGSGLKYPTVDAVNIQTNNLARATVQTGFIDTSDGFSLYKYDDNTLGISGSTIGIAFSQLFKVPPFTPSNAIVQLTSRLVPLSNIGLTGGSAVKFVGYRQSDDSIIFSDINFIQSPTICQLGVVIVKYSAGTTSFVDSTRTFINQPDIAAYSNLETTGFGVKSSVIVNHNGNDLKIKNTGGSLIGISVNWHGNNNDLLPITISDPTGTTFTYLYPGAALSPSPVPFVSNIDPTRYWNGSALTQVGIISGATVQRFIVTIRGNIAVQYSEFVYASFNDALNNATVQTFSDVLPIGTFAEIGRLVVTSGATDLSDTSKAIFLSTGGAGGGSTVSPTVVSWGSITGSITDQTDLQASLDSKIDKGGIMNYVTKWDNSSGLTNSLIYDTGTQVGLGLTTPSFGYIFHISGSTKVEGGDVYVRDGGVIFGNTAQNAIYKGGTDFFIMRNYNQDYTITEIWAPPSSNVILDERESTLALVREDTSGNAEFMDVYNNGYISEKQYGLRIQKRGTGQFRDFVIDYSTGLTGNISVLRLNETKVSITKPLLINTNIDNGIDVLQVSGSVISTAFKKSGGTSSQFLMADGSTSSIGITINIQSGTTYTLLNSDLGKQIITTNSAAVTITILSGLTLGFNCEVLQQGTGQVLFISSGTTLHYSTFELPSIVERYGIVAIDNIPNVTEEYNLYGKLTAI